MTRKPDYGHRNWNHWNVALWISSDEILYQSAMAAICRTKTLTEATHIFFIITGLRDRKTPDGARYNKTSVHAALAGIKS